MNNISIIGRNTREIELKTAGTTQIANFSVAVQRSFADKKTGEKITDFFNCVAFGKTAENLSKYVKKGNQIGIVGSIQFGEYENKEGQKVKKTDLVVNSFTFISEQKQQQQTAPQFNQMLSEDDMPF
ncbi:MAG: single-stranded DNA-binding protein [Culicoidibacterales bacterium]